jgi:RNA polymerase sigma-70 factor, ECF subfamily
VTLDPKNVSWNVTRRPSRTRRIRRMRIRTSGEEESEEELVSAALRARDGDLRAFEALVQRHQRRIVADCRYMTRDEGVAEDLAQEVFVKAFFGLRNFEGRSSFRHWLQRIKVHHCLNHIKTQAGRKQVSIEDELAEASEQLQVPAQAQKNFESRDDRERIARILDSIPSTLRIPLIMRDMDDLSYEEIATSLGIGLSAVKMRIKRAREAFRRQYEGEMASAKAAVHS